MSKKQKTIINLKECEFFAMPENFQTIESWIARHPASDQIHLFTVQWMTINLICKLAKEGLLSIEGLQVKKAA